MTLANKVALITGATSGIGKATAELFAQAGAIVIGVGRDKTRGNQLLEELNSISKQKHLFLQADVTNHQLIKEVVETVYKNYGAINILINNAGIAPLGTVETMTEEEWDYAFAVNVRSIFLFSKYVIPIMRQAGGGSIVNIGSTAGTVGAWGLHAYSASKGAVIQLSKSMAAEYGKDLIRVNALCPGGTLTPMMDYLEDPEGQKKFAQMFPLGRLAEPIEIAQAALFLVSDQASFITGAVLLADGGFTAI
jgi:NAD(P)-dependent dehydrogenase (short-subunit alcohol dehydrogenase family)